jgi:microcystin-dependent protein
MVWGIGLAERVAGFRATTSGEGRMVDQYLGEIKMTGFNFAPIGWAQCQGQIVSIQQYAALFSLFGTMYGGNGSSNFGWPDLQGRAPGHVGPNLYTVQGMKLGTETVTIGSTTYPMHSHSFNVSANGGTANLGGNNYLSTAAQLPVSPPPAPPPPAAPRIYTTGQGAALQPLFNAGQPPVIGFAPGSSQPHENMMPFVAMNYCVALSGTFPARG